MRNFVLGTKVMADISEDLSPITVACLKSFGIDGGRPERAANFIIIVQWAIFSFSPIL